MFTKVIYYIIKVINVMFKKLLKKFKKGNETETLGQVSSAENIPNQEISECSQVFEDTIESFEGDSHID